MRLTKLLLVFLFSAACAPAQAQSSPSQDTPTVTVPSHPPAQLFRRFDYAARGPIAFFTDPEWKARMSELTAKRRREMTSTIAGTFPNTCFKLRKYVFQPKPKAKDGMQPVGDEMQMVGETDCTYANKVWPKSADRLSPPPSQFGVQSTVLRQK